MNKNNTFGIIALLIVMMSMTAMAASAELIVNKYTNDFSASTPNNEQLKLCTCESKLDRVIIENTGNFLADFHVAVSTSYPGTIRVPNADFQLAPKHFQEVLIYVEDSCGITGAFSYDVVVTNSYGRKQIISRSMRSDICQTAHLEVTPTNITVGLCAPALFQAAVSNVGPFADNFALDFGPYNDVAKLPIKNIHLAAGQTYVQNVTFTFPCTDYGTKTIPFVLLTEKGGRQDAAWRDITILNQYDYALSLPTSVDVCAQTTTDIPVALENDAAVPDDLLLRLSAPSFVSFPTEAHLPAKDTKMLNLHVAPAKTDIGSHKVTIASNDVYGGIAKTREMTLVVNNCYDISVESRSAPTVRIDAPIQTCCGENTFYVNVQNNGDREQAFNINIDGPSFFVLDETTVRLQPGQNMNIPIRATLPCVDDRYVANILVYPVGQEQVNATTQLVVDSQTQRTCHMVQIDDDELRLTDDATVAPVIVKHTGSAGGTYAIDMNSTLFKIQEQEITLAPGDQRAIHLIPLQNLSAQERGRYIVQPSFTLSKQSIVYNEHVGVQLEEKGFFAKLADAWDSINWQNMTRCAWVIFALALLVLVAFVILIRAYAGKSVKENGMSRKSLTVLKTFLVLAVIVLLVLIVFAQPPSAALRYERVSDTTNAMVIEWYQNEQKSIDMSQYFVDPDHDIISYTVTQPRDVSVRVSGSVLLLTPDHNFAGENTMVITANDRKGGIVDSPLFVLRVIPQKELSFTQWLSVWCVYIVLIELILLLLFVFLLVLTIKERRANPRENNVLVVVNKHQNGKTVRRGTASSDTLKNRVVIVPKNSARITKTKKTTSTKTLTKKSASVKTVGGRLSARSSGRLPARPSTRSSRNTAIVSSLPVRRATRTSVQSKVVGRPTILREGQSVLREYKASGQTVNIAVGAQPAVANAAQLVAVPGVKQSEVVYVGARGGNTVHTPYCMNARRIPRNKRIAYTTKKEAINAGLVPCRMCRPFEGGM